MNSISKMHDEDSPRSNRLPERVAKTILSQQDASERLVGWFQLAVVIFFGLLYGVSPKTFSTDQTFSLVPWFLAVYLLLTIGRLFLSYRGRMSAPLLYASVIIDMGLLLAMIWAFHVQYQQPPSFYLKAPTLLYVFIFIALRSLRFEARYVITAGIVAAAGWTALAAYAAIAAGGQDMVTRNYVDYLTSNRILIGAELDKIITILTVTAILAVAIIRARKLLVKAVAEGTAARDLSRFFSPEIARQITAADQEVAVGKGKTREVAILMVDIRGFTRLASVVKPDDLIGAAVATGQTIFGAVGDATRMEYTVIGDAVNLAAKLEKHTKSEGVRALCTAAAFETALRQGYRAPEERKKLINRNIEGVNKPQDIVVLAQ